MVDLAEQVASADVLMAGQDIGGDVVCSAKVEHLLSRHRKADRDPPRAQELCRLCGILAGRKTLVSAGDYDDGSIRLWDVASGQNTATVMTDHMDLYGLALSPDGKTLASAALRQIKLWDVKTR